MSLVAHGHIEMAQVVVNRIASEPIKNHLMRMSVIKSKKACTVALETYTEVKNELISEYGKEVEGGVQIDPRADYFEEFNAKYDEIAMAEVEFNPPVLPPILLDMVELSADDTEILILVGLVKDGDEPEAS